MRSKTSYITAAPTSPAAKGAALALFFSGIAFALLYPSLTARPPPHTPAAAGAPGSTWSNIKRREA
jgi:hypothetical protein